MSQQPINMPAPNGDHRLKCGQCRWFVQGYQGKTCQQTRLVQPDTRACVEFQLFKESPFHQIEKDKFVLESRRNLMVWTEATMKQYESEIKGFKITGYAGDVFADPMGYIDEQKLAELGHKFEVLQAMMDRLLDMRYEIRDKWTDLQALVKDIQSYLFANYRDHVQGLKNEGERGAFFRAAAPEVFKATEKMENLKEKTDLAFENLKQTHFNLARKQDAILELYKARINSVDSNNRAAGKTRTSG